MEQLWFPQRAYNLRPYDRETKPEPPIPDRVQDEGSPSSAPDGAPSPQGEGETVSESDTADEELDPRSIDELAAPDGKRYTGYGATFKNATRTRLLAMRAQGLTTGEIMAAADGQLGYGELMDIIEANKVRVDVYETLAGILDEIEAARGKTEADG